MNILFLEKYFYKYTNKEKYREIKEKIRFENRKNKLTESFSENISQIRESVAKEEVLNFKHSGHLGDIIYALPVIQELSKNHRCNLYIQVDAPTDSYAYKHAAGKVYVNQNMFSKLLPLLKTVDYIYEVKAWNGEKINVDLDLFREFPFEWNFLTVRWYVHITGVFPDFTRPSLEVEPHPVLKDKVAIIRTFRARNSFVDYGFLKEYNNLLFLGLKEEYEDLKKSVPNLEYYDCKDFLELAQIIKASRFYLGNQSFGFSLAEMLKVPRLLEAYADFPVVHPVGGQGFDFYFQQDFELLFKKLYYGAL